MKKQEEQNESLNSSAAQPVSEARPAETLSPGRNRMVWAVATVGVLISAIVAMTTDGPTLWGLLPIVLYAVLAILGMDIIIASVVAIISGTVLAGMGIPEIGEMLEASVADSITVIGLIVMLGAGLGEVLQVTGVAQNIVAGVMKVFGRRGRYTVVIGIMLACLVLVAATGTLPGAIAIAVPMLLPVAARLGFTKSATASMLFIGGCAGLAIAPFVGSNIAIMEAAEVSYGQYLLYGAGPLSLLSLILGVPIVALIQRWTEKKDDWYTAEEVGDGETGEIQKLHIPTIVFLSLLSASVIFAAMTSASTSFPLVALPILAIGTAAAGRMKAQEIAVTIYRGCSRAVNLFILFWLLAALLIIIEKLAPFDIVIELFGSRLESASPFAFGIIVALLGWVGVPGATAAQVILLDRLFGDLGSSLGLGANSWVAVLLFASKADTYGPFPNGNMVPVMGLARSTNLKHMLITGWLVLVPACVMYISMIFVQTR